MAKHSKNRRKTQDELRERSEVAIDALREESDRSVPLIGAEWVNDALGELLFCVFAKNGIKPDDQKTLVNSFSNGYGSFGARIIVCRAFGLLPNDVCDKLDLLREIRNHCGHSVHAAQLTDDKIVNQVRALEAFAEDIAGRIMFLQLMDYALRDGALPNTEETHREARAFVAQRIKELKPISTARVGIISAVAFLSGYVRGQANLISPQEHLQDTLPTLPPMEVDATASPLLSARSSSNRPSRKRAPTAGQQQPPKRRVGRAQKKSPGKRQ